MMALFDDSWFNVSVFGVEKREPRGARYLWRGTSDETDTKRNRDKAVYRICYMR